MSFQMPKKAREQLIARGDDPDTLVQRAAVEPDVIPGQLDLEGHVVDPPAVEPVDVDPLRPASFPFYDSMTLAEARELLRELAVEGHRCPCCTQLAKVYPRTINSSMARDLIALWREAGHEWAYLPDVRRRSGSLTNREESKLRYWGLIEEEPTVRPDGGRAGWWRVTDLGRMFVLGQVTVPKYAHVYDSRCLRLDGPTITIHDALGDHFDYAELMGRAD